jgi:hypothetical protein
MALVAIQRSREPADTGAPIRRRPRPRHLIAYHGTGKVDQPSENALPATVHTSTATPEG